MFRRNVGTFDKMIGLYKPSSVKRDELGGVKEREFEHVAYVMAQIRNKTASMSQIVGDYVTMDTRYFLMRDFRSIYPITEKWQIKVNNVTYVINSINIIDDIKPAFLEVEATKVGGLR